MTILSGYLSCWDWDCDKDLGTQHRLENVYPNRTFTWCPWHCGVFHNVGKITQINTTTIYCYCPFCLTYERSANLSCVNSAEFSPLLPYEHPSCLSVGLSRFCPFLCHEVEAVSCVFVTVWAGCCNALKQSYFCRNWEACAGSEHPGQHSLRMCCRERAAPLFSPAAEAGLHAVDMLVVVCSLSDAQECCFSKSEWGEDISSLEGLLWEKLYKKNPPVLFYVLLVVFL